MIERSWRVWFENLEGGTDVTYQVFFDERKATDFCEWFGGRKHVSRAYLVESAIETNPR